MHSIWELQAADSREEVSKAIIENFLEEFYDRNLSLSTFRMATKRSGDSSAAWVRLTSWTHLRIKHSQMFLILSEGGRRKSVIIFAGCWMRPHIIFVLVLVLCSAEESVYSNLIVSSTWQKENEILITGTKQFRSTQEVFRNGSF